MTIGNTRTQNKTLKFYLVYLSNTIIAQLAHWLHYTTYIKRTRTGLDAMQYISEKDNLTKERNTAFL